MKNILIISAKPLDCNNATGITLRNIFQEFNEGQLYHLYNDTKFSNLKNSFNLNKKVIPNNCLAVEGNKSTGVTHNNFKSSLKDILPFYISSELQGFLRESKIDIIYSLLGNIRTLDMTYKIHNYLKAPVVIHFMDDWPGSLYQQSFFFLLQGKILQHKLKKILNISKKVYVISDYMQVEYKRRYDIESKTLMNCIQPQLYKENIKANKIKILYSGGLHLQRDLVLEKVLFISSKYFKNFITFDLFLSEQDQNTHRDLFFKYSDIIGNIQYVSPENVSDLLSNYNLLMHLEAFDKDVIKYTKFSISTKIPQYLAASRAILAFGPRDIASIDYISRNNVGYVCNDLDKIKNTFEEILNDLEKIDTYSKNAFFLANEKHSCLVQSVLFKQDMENI
ncbi:hypothetical protein E0H86_05165 [Acinetobacter sp. ANC 4635]|uniref:hypothetical protein n=1 Tax=Acinetobacter sp. ANC 4635 TaxID=2529846 RepID=UPI0010406E6F|nr:hypothetical protein [Acinetobacter sp. ANC 4635]TCB32834.1 hypothetical protein E0H86_05165 [Acinetobacter sp. ANC 4635]